MSRRPFRFGLQTFGASSKQEWCDHARRAEDAGFDTILVADHVADGVLSPIAALTVMADATTRLRVGTLVLNNDFRHPSLLAREAATLDLLSDGRLELGLGAGHSAPEYTEIGCTFDPPSVRVDRLDESVRLIRRLFAGETVTIAGEHYDVRDHRLFPHRRPALLVGGNGDRVLRLAAREADIVGFTGLGRTRPDSQQHETEWTDDQIDRKVALVRETAAGRIEQVELNALVQYTEITDERRDVAERLAQHIGGDPDDMLTAPFMLIGSLDEIVGQVERARDRWGITYFVTREFEPTARVIDAIGRV